MKGVIFREFIELVELKFGVLTLDNVLQATPLASGGAYTSVGTYDASEMVALVGELSRQTDLPADQLCVAFGEYLFERLYESYEDLVSSCETAYDLLSALDGIIHVAVQRVYPDAECPSVRAQRVEGGGMVVTYRSKRPFADVAEGLIRGCASHYGESLELRREDLGAEQGCSARFEIACTKAVAHSS
ncbi:MAG: heme NO-binding domain-containing protein [Planctomycetales bacterium]|nr:heme NO-binding domain-containing protein [Planctomycetales bacterium]